MKNVIIGTAGHIDHGKTTLIKALTGRETDRLKEEKKRGISIDLGFTYFDLPSGKRAGIVDVPGHEKFIKNMLAGVSGMDMVLLVVAADEGVMPQTIEHLDILNFLNIKNGIIVITKSDLVEKDFLDLVKEDIREQVKDTFLKDALIIETDSISKRGIDDLIEAIDKISEEVESKNLNSPPRLNIDRVFSIKGFGTVVTGTLIEGKINVEDNMVIYPKGINTKVRSIQVHGNFVKTAYAGQRVAINLANVKVEEIERGDVLAYPNSLMESMMIDIKISLVKHASRKLQYWDRIRLYHGTREILGRIVPLDKENINLGDTGYCQIRLEESIVAKNKDMFVIRFYSPMETIGGGVILDTNPKKHRRFDEEVLKSLKLKESGDTKEIIEEIIKKHSKEYPSLKDISVYIGEKEEIIKEEVNSLCMAKKIANINNLYIHKDFYEYLKEKTLSLLSDFHKKHPLKKGLLKEELRSRVEKKLKIKDFDSLLALFVEDEKIKILENLISLYDFEVVFNEVQAKIKEEIESKLKNDGLTPRNITDIIQDRNEYKEVLEALIGDTLIRVSDDLIYHKEYYEKALDMVKKHIKENGSLTLGNFRDLIGASRKYAMALLDDFDRNKITKRIGDKRVLI
ncbi:selenocysteine-specific translation elongation factor [Tepidibacter formicigenes]|jgi:selenocysteine-specific elongation factor|uniref:Selenocysteine-specific elongation factor n=1 Tax=Tepidibacter formicigenes DSM 15518 TaxID=1123349 RepID=A0A1M6LYY4_9FIRM|nr:selenocysteine-specific translation elongation factor [Tepidibacter formicigenes]SHJ76419.1 selenocysteine-specific elongation factor [Tepidibacter formicigenes DSM 15518]